MKWLRYILDRIAAHYEAHHPIDWSDCYQPCADCERIERRNERIAQYRVSKHMPKARARVKVLVE